MSSERVDWFRVLVQLDRAGLNVPTVARALGVSRKTLYSIRSFAEPRHDTGQALIRLWCATLGHTAEAVPTRTKDVSVAKAKV